MSESTMRIGLLFFGGVNVVLGLLMVFAPETFFDEIGPYGIRNDHYIGDTGTFHLAAGAALLLAVQKPEWRQGLLVFAALWYGFHAVNHLFDIGENNEGDARGIVDTILLALGAAVLAFMARAAGNGAEGAGVPASPPPRAPARGGDYPPGD